MLEVDGVSKRFGALQALDRASFSVADGEMFGLLGPNGAGKTTLLSILSCLMPADGGRATVAGHQARPGNDAVKRLLGIVPQELAVYDNLTASENLAFFGELFGLGGAELARRVERLLVAVGLESRARTLVGTFSGGMKRRLNLAVSLVHAPRLLLLDEPTVGVDPQSRALIFEEVRRLNREEGMTVVYTSHYMEEVEALCERVAIMDGGKVVASGGMPELLHELRGLVRVRVKGDPAALMRRLEGLPDATARLASGSVEVECGDVKGTLVRLIGAMNELNVEMLSLETEEPNLERVFLHLTGRALRD
ncbi:MAG: ABC transporter ATP-binding protein [Gemmataceae bacterium]|nr:ABC transporter ATP-binding protein [Gemmataceae bacterium]